jgi:hypothetical protein
MLAFSDAFPETLREQLLVQWSEETSMPDRTYPPQESNTEFSYTPDSQSNDQARAHDSKSVSAQSHSSEPPNFIHPRQRSLSKYLERSPSPATNIDQLRRVLAGSRSDRDSIPKIEINGEKVLTPAESQGRPSDELEGKDVTMILESLNISGGEWKEKSLGSSNEKVNGISIHPPYM